MPWYSSTGFIQVPPRSEQEKDVQDKLLKSVMEKVRQGRTELDALAGVIAKYPKFQEVYDYLLSKFTILEQNIDQLKIALATKV